MAETQPDTVPPPPGEDDAYSAETRVGALPQGLLDALREIRAEESAAQGRDDPPSSEAPVSVAAPDEGPPLSVPAHSQGSEDLAARAAEADENDSTEPTLDKPIRYLKRQESKAVLAVDDAALSPGTSMRDRGFGPLTMMIVIFLGFVAAVLAWKLGL